MGNRRPLIKLAASLPKGDVHRRTLLSRLKSGTDWSDPEFAEAEAELKTHAPKILAWLRKNTRFVRWALDRVTPSLSNLGKGASAHFKIREGSETWYITVNLAGDQVTVEMSSPNYSGRTRTVAYGSFRDLSSPDRLLRNAGFPMDTILLSRRSASAKSIDERTLRQIVDMEKESLGAEGDVDPSEFKSVMNENRRWGIATRKALQKWLGDPENVASLKFLHRAFRRVKSESDLDGIEKAMYEAEQGIPYLFFMGMRGEGVGPWDDLPAMFRSPRDYKNFEKWMERVLRSPFANLQRAVENAAASAEPEDDDNYESIAKDYEIRANSERRSGGSTDHNPSVGYIAITRSDGEEYFFQESDYDSLEKEYNEDPTSDHIAFEDWALAMSQSW